MRRPRQSVTSEDDPIMTPAASDDGVEPRMPPSQNQDEEISPDDPIPSIEQGMQDLNMQASVRINLPNGTTLRAEASPITNRTDTVDVSSTSSKGKEVRRGSTRGQQSLSPPAPERRSRSASRRRSSFAIAVDQHQVTDETPPDAAFYKPEFQETLKRTKGLMSNLTEVLTKNQLHKDPASSIYECRLKAIELSEYRCAETRKIALVGDSGVGKSTLINSLLDMRNLARSSNGGAACTCAATEFHYHRDERMRIEVQYFSKPEMEQQFREMIRAYRYFHLHEYDSKIAAAERTRLREAADVAWYTIEAAFRNKTGMSRAFLQGADEGAVIDHCKIWLQQLIDNGLAVGSIGTSVGYPDLDLRACSERLASATSEAFGSTEWPFIKNVRVLSNAVILSKGLVLVDLPGLHDINAARRKIAEQYLRDSDEILAVCLIGRATTDQGVQATVRLAQQARLGRISIVCTRSDDIIATEARVDWDRHPSTQMHATLINELQDAIDDVTAQISELDEYIDQIRQFDDLDEAEHAEENRLVRERDQLRNQQLPEAHFNLTAHLVNTRNAMVTRGLREQYGDALQHVFCISNRFYWDYRKERRRVAMPWLKLSNIIDLRQHCVNRVAAFLYDDATTFMREAVPALLARINLWILAGNSSVSAGRRASLQQSVDAIEQDLRSRLRSQRASLNRADINLTNALVQQLLSHMGQGECNTWSQAATQAARAWSGWCYATYAAFCRNYGDHTTPAGGTHCWNEDLIGWMVRDLQSHWPQLNQAIDELFATHRNNLIGVFDSAIARISAMEDGALDGNISRELSEALEILGDAIAHHQRLLLATTNNLIGTFKQNVTKLGNTDLCSGIRTSFIGQQMENAYADCICDFGTGVDRRRKTLIHNAVSSPDLFPAIRAQFESAFNTLAQRLQEDITAANREHFQAVQRALRTLRDESVVTEAEQDPEFRERVRAEVERAQRELRRR